MVERNRTRDATFFAAHNTSELLKTEIRKIEARLSELKSIEQWHKCLVGALDETSDRKIAMRAKRLADIVNEDPDHVFVRELESLDFDQLCFFAKSYRRSMEREPRADFLQVFMWKEKKAIIDEDTQRWVGQGAARVGGKFLDIYETARTLKAQATPALSREAWFTQITEEAPPQTTLGPIPKYAFPNIFHQDLINMMQKHKAYGGAETPECCNIKGHVYGDVTEWRIEVPRGIDSRTIDILAKQGGGEIVYRDTIDIVVVKIHHAIYC